MPDIIELAESDNIAELLDGKELAKIGGEVVADFDADMESRRQWEAKQKEAMALASQITEDKNHPWPGAANVKFPLLTEAAVQFNSRIYPALLPTIDLVKARVVGFDHNGAKMNQAIRVSKHMTWQLTEEMEEWEEDMDRALLGLPINGCFFKKTYFDANIERNRSEAISAMDFVLDYFAKTVEDAHRKTHVLYYTENEYRKGVLSGIFLDEDLGQPTVEDEERVGKEGESPSTRNDAAARYTFLEQHTYRDLDEDGLAEPYIFTVDKHTQKVIRIVAGFDIDDVIVDSQRKIIDVPQIQYFTKYGFIPNPDGGVYDIGFGQLLSPMNKTVDTLINQLLDAGTLSNMQAGFLARGVRLRGGMTKFQPGEWKTVDSRGDDLRKGVFPLPVREPSNVLFQLLGLMINTGQRLASTIDSMVGENPGQNQKATTTLAVLEQGQKVFNGIYKRLHRSFKKELKKLYKLNSMHLPAQSYLNVLDMPISSDQAEMIRRDDYDEQNVNVVPAADSNIASQQQKLMKAQALMELLPLGTVNPVEATRRVLEAEEQPAIEQLMDVGPRQPSPDEIKLQQENVDMAHRHQLEWAQFSMELLQLEQEELKTRAEVILNLAKAEGEEMGAQIDQYKAQLDQLAQKSKDISQRLTDMSKPKQAPSNEAA